MNATSRMLQNIQVFYPDVASVKDGARPLQIEVTPRDAVLSTRKNHRQCALARACKASAAIDGVVVSRAIAFLVKGRMARRYELSGALKQQIRSFDKGNGFAAGEYTLLVPPKSHRIGFVGSRGETGTQGPRKKYQPRVFDHEVRAALGSGKRVVG